MTLSFLSRAIDSASVGTSKSEHYSQKYGMVFLFSLILFITASKGDGIGTGVSRKCVPFEVTVAETAVTIRELMFIHFSYL